MAPAAARPEPSAAVPPAALKPPDPIARLAAVRKFCSASAQLLNRTRATSAAAGICNLRAETGRPLQADSTETVNASSTTPRMPTVTPDRPFAGTLRIDVLSTVSMAVGRRARASGSQVFVSTSCLELLAELFGRKLGSASLTAEMQG